jgi:Tfp pilus assembly protein PilX
MSKQRKSKQSDRGFAIIFAMLAMLVLGLLATTVMVTSQGQVLTSLNYRLTAQSRYAAESGVQSTMNWLGSSSYTAPTVFTSYDMTKNPVQYNGKPVVLSATSGVKAPATYAADGSGNIISNYPDATVASAYSSALSKSLPGVSKVSYSTYAMLLRMTPSGGVSWLPGGGGGGGVVQTWQITSVGIATGARNASVQVVETFERTSTPIFNYGLEATGTGCGAMTFTGGDYTDSYNSTQGVYGGANVGTAGNIATNGNVSLGGGGGDHGGGVPKINGTIAAANNTVGACPGAGLTDSSSGNYLSLTAVNPPLNPPLPWGCTAQPCYPPGTLVTTPQNIGTISCLTISGCKSNGTTTLTDGGSSTTANVFTLSPGSYGNVTINNADVIHVSAGTYNINSINFAKDGQFVVDSGPVVFNIVGNCASGCPSESGLPSGYSSTEVIYGAGNAGFNGCAPSGGTGVVANPDVYGKVTCGPSKTAYSGIPNNLQIVYGGTDTMRLGGMPNALALYAPNSSYYTPGAPVGLYGSAIVKNFNDQSGSPFHYDTALPNTIAQVGPYRPVGGFSWSKF